MTSLDHATVVREIQVRPMRLRERLAAGREAAAALCAVGCEGSTRVWVADFQGQIVASVSLLLEESYIALIRDLWIDARWRDSMVPLLIMIKVLEDARTLGALKVKLDTSVQSFTMALLIDSGLLLSDHRCGGSAGQAECYLNLYKHTHVGLPA